MWHKSSYEEDLPHSLSGSGNDGSLNANACGIISNMALQKYIHFALVECFIDSAADWPENHNVNDKDDSCIGGSHVATFEQFIELSLHSRNLNGCDSCHK
ncbi:hypothetical protein ACLKA6_009240 [Drosophila palustris]